MTRFWFGPGAAAVATNDIDLEASTLKCMLLMSNTTCDSEPDAVLRTDFTDMDEMDGSGYTAGGVALTTKSVAYTNVPSRQVQVDADNVAFGTLMPGSRQISAYLVYDSVTDRPLIYDDGATGLPFTIAGGGETVTIQWASSGWTYLRSNPLV